MSNRNPRPGAAAGASLSGSGGLDWQPYAACKGEDPELFFAPEVESEIARQRREARAKAVCSRCPVWRACLDWRLGFEHQRDGGIWGALDEEERWKLRKNRVRAARRNAA